MAWTEFAPMVAAIIVAIVAAYTDATRGKVYNWLTAPAFALGFVINGICHGAHGLVIAAEGAGLAIGLLLVLSLLGRLVGGGDAKLIIALGALLGPVLLLRALAIGAIAGGIWAVAVMLARGRVAQELAALGRSVIVRIWGGCRMDAYASSSSRLPYAVPLACGVVICVLAQTGVIPT